MMSEKRNGFRTRSGRGTIIAYYLIVLSVVITGLLVTMAFSSGTQVQMGELTLDRDQAFYAAEGGIQEAFWQLQANGNWRADPATPFTGSVGRGTYSVSAVGDWNSPVLLTSVGHAGVSGQSTVSAVCSPTVTVPALSLGNNFDNNGNVVIAGDVEAKGDISTSGKLRLGGYLHAGGTVTTHGSVDVSGGTAQGVQGITVPVIDINALVSRATQVHHVPQGNGKTYTVDSLNFGQGGIVYFDGSIAFKGSTTVTGYGTLIVNGDVTIQSAASFGSSSQKALANIVTVGNLDVGGYLGIVGSLYVGGTLSKHGGIDLTGVIVTQQDLDTAGGMNITRAQPPAFDPRSSISGQGTVTLSSFTGPIFQQN